jgi:hypothetical protein
VCDFVSFGACFICHPRAAEALAKAKAGNLCFMPRHAFGIWNLKIEVCDLPFKQFQFF